MPDYALMNQCIYEGKAKEVEEMTKAALAEGKPEKANAYPAEQQGAAGKPEKANRAEVWDDQLSLAAPGGSRPQESK